jgi:hypothetical protein
MPAANSTAGRDPVPRESRSGGARGEEQQRVVAGGVESKAEQRSDHVHVPRPAHRPRKPVQEAAHQPARCEPPLEHLLVVVAAAHL